MASSSSGQRVALDVFAAGCGAAMTDSFFNPLEVVKIRLQAPGQQLYRGALHCGRSILATDGLKGLWWPGLVATWIRSYTYTAARIGLYSSVRSLYAGDIPDRDLRLWRRVAAGASTGALASLLFSPVDLVRIRLTQEAGRVCPSTGVLLSGLQAGSRPRYAHTFAAFADVAREEGLRGLWRGASAHILRAAALSGGQLASYDGFKVFARERGLEEGPRLHVAASLGSGFVGQTVAMPVDTVRTRVMGAGAGVGAYASVASCVRGTLASEGLRGFYIGYLPALMRQCPVMLVQMPLVEQVRALLGLGYI